MKFNDRIIGKHLPDELIRRAENYLFARDIGNDQIRDLLQEFILVNLSEDIRDIKNEENAQIYLKALTTNRYVQGCRENPVINAAVNEAITTLQQQQKDLPCRTLGHKLKRCVLNIKNNLQEKSR